MMVQIETLLHNIDGVRGARYQYLFSASRSPKTSRSAAARGRFPLQLGLGLVHPLVPLAQAVGSEEDSGAVALRFLVRRKVAVAPCVQCIFKLSIAIRYDQNKAIETNERSYLVKDLFHGSYGAS